MKKKRKKKEIESKTVANPPAVASPNPAAPASVPATAIETGPYGLPPADVLYHEAEQEEDQQVLRDYAEVIKLLREKHFSFREIAEWLNERGFKTDRNEVYRIYCKILPPDVEAYEAQAADEEEAAGM